MAAALLNNRKHLSLLLVINVAYLATATAFDKENSKSSLIGGQQSHQNQPQQQVSRIPAEQQKELEQRQQEVLDAVMGRYQWPPSSSLEEQELEQRLLLSSLLENGRHNMDNRFYYNAGPHANAYNEDEQQQQLDEDENGNGRLDETYLMQNQEKRSSPSNSLFYVFRRGCIRRGGNCDHRPNDCCYSSSCRCNLWGSNCRCQRMGLFQKWG